MGAETHLNEQRCLLADVVDELQLGQRLQGGRGRRGGWKGQAGGSVRVCATVGINNLCVCPFFIAQCLFSLLPGRKHSCSASCVRIPDTLLDAFSSETAE